MTSSERHRAMSRKDPGVFHDAPLNDCPVESGEVQGGGAESQPRGLNQAGSRPES